MRIAGLLSIVVATASLVLSQPGAFEASSIEPNLGGIDRDIGINISGSRIRGANLLLRTMILQAWRPRAASEITGKDFTGLLQRLLADRFHLVTPRETREMEIYVPVVDKNGTKLRQTTGTPANSMSGFNQRAVSGRAGMVGAGVPMSALRLSGGRAASF